MDAILLIGSNLQFHATPVTPILLFPMAPIPPQTIVP